jgi:hypothetical protein
MRGNTRSVTLRHEDDHYAAAASKICGFVAMQGVGEHREGLLLLRGKEVGLRITQAAGRAVPTPCPFTQLTSLWSASNRWTASRTRSLWERPESCSSCLNAA